MLKHLQNQHKNLKHFRGLSAIKTTNMKRLSVDRGVLDHNEAFLMAVSCDSFQFGQEDTNNDRSTIEWTNTPDDAAPQFRRVW
uniref:MSP domain-containing protein n=1 Tax=Panagrolaimus davidi TaxID=227884 RepID=A0A914Q5L6_9BILA